MGTDQKERRDFAVAWHSLSLLEVYHLDFFEEDAPRERHGI